MKYTVDVRARALQTEPYEVRHREFFAALKEIPHPWGLEGREGPPVPRVGNDYISTGISFTNLLGKGIRGQVMYQGRFVHLKEDIAANDDFVDLSFNPEKVAYSEFVKTVFPIYITTFAGYSAFIYDEAFNQYDWDAGRAWGIDGRHGVFRIHPVSYFDRLLCQRAFQLTPEQIADRLANRIEEVRLLHDGVYLIGSSEPLEFDVARDLSDAMKRWVEE
jgi:hypothetical protein